MPASVEITPWYWVGFILLVLVFLALDLGLFHRHAHVVRLKEALIWTLVWLALALAFAAALVPLRGKSEALQFCTGYFLELSLSVDNVFVIVLIFASFRIPPELQHRVLIWGVLGALVMRGLMILLGVALINRFDWLLYVFGAFLLFTGIRMLVNRGASGDPAKGLVARIVRGIFPVAPDFDGQKFFTRQNGRRMMTPLLLVLVVVETADLIFAVDSIPAIFGVTRKPFIVFTSNVFAILGLRSLYFALAGAIGLFRYLKAGISLVLVFIGIKMLIDPHDAPPRWFQYDIPDTLALASVVGIIAVSILASIIVTRREAAAGARPTPPSA
ncbi:MAG TPA: TerC family protein [Verrucomicrobiae bacterium]|jgi:tellurite resistance protein TerC|nr:TerC family protein [Verrucomicrobiae bacterium]